VAFWHCEHGNLARLRFHALHGMPTCSRYDGIMHRGTHMDAPIHVTANLPYITAYEPWRFFGTGVAVSIPKRQVGA
jgi:kynurenine formamidase